MQNPLGAPGGGLRQTGYVFVAGLVVGIIIGWSMSGLISFVIRLALIVGVVALVAFAVNFWLNTKRSEKNGTIDTAWRDPRGPGSTR